MMNSKLHHLHARKDGHNTIQQHAGCGEVSVGQLTAASMVLATSIIETIHKKRMITMVKWIIPAVSQAKIDSLHIYQRY